MKTVFFRAIETAVDKKAIALREAIGGASASRFEAETSSFASIPRSPFCYWVTDRVREIFEIMPPFESGERVARQGGVTGEDFRFLRLSWERPLDASRKRWAPFAKGGAYSPFYSDIPLVVWWDFERNTFLGFTGLKHRPSLQPASFPFYFRPGLTWPLRTNGLSVRAMPSGCVFGHKGPAAFEQEDDPDLLLSLCAIANSSAFGALVAVQLARTELAQSFEVGLIQQTPVPTLDSEHITELAGRAHRSWSLKRQLDTRVETSHAFVLPALLQVNVDGLADRAHASAEVTESAQFDLETLAAEIDDHTYRLYMISDGDRQLIEQGFGASAEPEDGPDDDDDDAEEEAAEVDAVPMVASLLSWSLGVAFGRFDVRLATGERPAPPDSEPFDSLPVCSPGMLTGDDGLPLAMPPAGYPLTFPTDGVLVDDPGHPRDLVGAVRSVFDTVFDDANGCWHEAAELLGTPDLRTWFARDFFEPHIKRYSKSRRKAPVYWQLATASGSYSVWIYIHRATSDTLFQILESDFLGGKLDHEKSKLDSLNQEAGANPSAAARREIELQENFVGELSALRTEIARIAPLWTPNLDDGTILNFAPLWRLVPQSRSWQAECKKAWDKLVSGEYDWAHVAMHLWPERVVLKCIDDRSLAIAHGLEALFWHEDASGTWHKQQVDETTVQKLIDERTSATVKAALKDLLSAATPAVSKGRKQKVKSSSPQSATLKTVPTVARAPAAEAIVDEATLNAVKAAIARVAGGASKADVLATTGLSDTDWNKAVAVLLDRGDVIRSGQKRGTRYQTKVS